jgi:ParB/RepB/Spo0J family partition protein
MHRHLLTVALSDIDVNDRRFVVTEGRDIAALQGSIAACGLLQPLCLWRPRPEDGYVIVCGSLRLQAACNLGLQQVEARVFDPAAGQAALLACALQDNLGHRVFNPVETAQALQRLLACLSRAEIIEQWLPRFGLSPSARTLERCLRLCTLEHEVRAALIAGDLTEASALRLSAYAADDRLAVFALMRQLHLSAGKQAELLECLEDLARRDAVPLREAAAAGDIVQVCRDERCSRVQKTGQVRRMLRLRRFPRLSAAEARFDAAIKELRMGQGIRITPPANFEGRLFRAEIDFSSADELRLRAGALMDAARQQACERLLAESGHAGGGPRRPEPQCG